jgi:hypothetical protein
MVVESARKFADPVLLRTLLGRAEAALPARTGEEDRIERERGKLERERQKLLRMTLKGTCTEEDFARESKRVEADLRDLDRLAPAPVPAAFDPAKLVVAIARAFARFDKQPFTQQRECLRAMVREFVLEGGAIQSFTVNRAFLGGANLRTQSIRPLSRQFQSQASKQRRW